MRRTSRHGIGRRQGESLTMGCAGGQSQDECRGVARCDGALHRIVASWSARRASAKAAAVRQQQKMTHTASEARQDCSSELVSRPSPAIQISRTTTSQKKHRQRLRCADAVSAKNLRVDENLEDDRKLSSAGEAKQGPGKQQARSKVESRRRRVPQTIQEPQSEQKNCNCNRFITGS